LPDRPLPRGPELAIRGQSNFNIQRGTWCSPPARPGPTGVGMFLQTLVVALTARGRGTCVQTNSRSTIPIPTSPANELGTGCNPIEQNVVFLDA
jgi:hypothetical protein